MDVAVEQNQLDVVYNDMKFIRKISKSNSDFVAVLTSPVINSDIKEKIITSITGGRVSDLTVSFIKLLVRKTRENNFPEIASAFITQYNELKNIRQVKITTAVPISEELQRSIADRVTAGKNIQGVELEAKVDPSLIGGFKLQMDDLLVDASISRDLSDVKKQFLSNEYIHRIR